MHPPYRDLTIDVGAGGGLGGGGPGSLSPSSRSPKSMPQPGFWDDQGDRTTPTGDGGDGEFGMGQELTEQQLEAMGGFGGV